MSSMTISVPAAVTPCLREGAYWFVGDIAELIDHTPRDATSENDASAFREVRTKLDGAWSLLDAMAGARRLLETRLSDMPNSDPQKPARTDEYQLLRQFAVQVTEGQSQCIRESDKTGDSRHVDRDRRRRVVAGAVDVDARRDAVSTGCLVAMGQTPRPAHGSAPSFNTEQGHGVLSGARSITVAELIPGSTESLGRIRGEVKLDRRAGLCRHRRGRQRDEQTTGTRGDCS
jgi:hypothetical protein